MQNWLLLALLAPAVITIVNFIDKYVIEHKVKDYRGMPIYGAVVAIIAGTVIWIITGFQMLPLLDALIVLFTGVLTMFGWVLYFNALSKSETSYIIGLFQLIPIIALVLAFFLLGETITPIQLGGFAVVLVSVIGLSVKKEKQKFKFDKVFYLVVLSDVFFALASVLIKFAITANSFTKILVFESWGLALGGLILFVGFPSVRHAFEKTTKTVGGKVLAIMLANEFIFIISKVLTFLAISLGPVGLVSVLSGTQVFYGVIYGLILTLIFPKLFDEDKSIKVLSKKILLMVILFAGILLMQ